MKITRWTVLIPCVKLCTSLKHTMKVQHSRNTVDLKKNKKNCLSLSAQTWLNSAIAVQHTSMQTLQSVQSACSEPVVLVLGKVSDSHGTTKCHPGELGQWNLFMPWWCIHLTFTVCPPASVMTPGYASLS